MRKNVLLIVIFLLAIIHTKGQANADFYYFEGQQPRSEINVSMAKHKKTGASGQNFGIIIQNRTQNKIKVYGRYYANLICNNQKSQTFEIVLKAGEQKGGASFLLDTDGLSETVFEEDCKAVNHNRIKNVGFQITSVVNLTEIENKKNEVAEADRKYKEESKRKYEEDQQRIKNQQNQQNEEQRKMAENQERINAIKQEYETKKQNDEQTINTIKNGVEDILKIPAPPRISDTDFDPSDADADNGFLYLSAGYAMPVNADQSLRKNGFLGGLSFMGRGEHFLFSAEAQYIYWMPINDEKANFILQNSNNSSISELKTGGTFLALLSWGPNLIRKNGILLALQPTIGADVSSTYTANLLGQDYSSDRGEGSGIAFHYGGSLRFFFGNWMASLSYLTNNRKETNLLSNNNGKITGNINESFLSLSISYRLY